MTTTSKAPLAIEACGLVKEFGAAIRAVDGLDLSVPSGDVFPLLGPNGAGKPITELRHSLPSKCGRLRRTAARRRHGPLAADLFVSHVGGNAAILPWAGGLRDERYSDDRWPYQQPR